MLPIIPGLIRRVLDFVTLEVYQQMQITGERLNENHLNSFLLLQIQPNHTNEAITQK